VPERILGKGRGEPRVGPKKGGQVSLFIYSKGKKGGKGKKRTTVSAGSPWQEEEEGNRDDP